MYPWFLSNESNGTVKQFMLSMCIVALRLEAGELLAVRITRREETPATDNCRDYEIYSFAELEDILS